MGRYVASINGKYVEYGDYSWDYVKHNQPLEYYKKTFIEVELDEEKIQVPVEELVDIYLVKTLYDWKWSDKKSLHRWLFKYLYSKNEIVKVKIIACLHSGNLNYDKPKIDRYYLNSPIGDDEIVLSTKSKEYIISNYGTYEWLRLRLLTVI